MICISISITYENSIETLKSPKGENFNNRGCKPTVKYAIISQPRRG
jgi:hypothetical protein